jgi:hypothetical protein
MKILPLRTLPPNERIERRHSPPEATGEAGYQDYRPCLRWDFGFTCAFCLLHEGDLAEFGAEGMGIMWIEHFTPASLDARQINDYENCFYACRFCNRSRWKAPLVDESGRRLIDPCRHVWGERFFLSEDDHLLPDKADPDAVYTAETYDLNDDRKVRRRRRRRERLTEWLAVLKGGPARIKLLITLAQRVSSLEDASLLVEEANSLRHRVILATLEIQRYFVVPVDADGSCPCGRDEHCRLPEWLAAQAQDFPAS